MVQVNAADRFFGTSQLPVLLIGRTEIGEIGFFVISAAHNVLRLPKDVLLASSEFFFHHSTTKDKKLVGKVVMAGAWAIKFPGEMTELEELEFKDNTTDIIANVSGDNVNLGPITRLTAIRSSRSVKILCNKTRA